MENKREKLVPLLQNLATTVELEEDGGNNSDQDFVTRVWNESKILWHIVGPSIFSRVATFSMSIITQAFAGHLGDLELASISIAFTVVVGFNFGLLLGMASALETLCGQAYGAKKYSMMGVYMQRSWIVLFMCAVLLLPMYIFATPILKLLGQPDDVAEQSGLVAIWMIPFHFSFAFLFPLQRFLQSQLKTGVIAWVSLVALIVHIFISWFFVYRLQYGLIGTAVTLNVSWWISVFGLFGYTVCGGCPLSWSGFSTEAFSGLWEFLKLSAASGNGKAAKFATTVSVVTSIFIGLIFCVLILVFHDKIAYIFTTSTEVINAVDKLAIILAFTILLNSVQPVLSGVALGSGWQAYVAYINIGCYYIIGVPLGITMGWVFHLGVMAEKASSHMEKLSSG
ncbi:hypothetical protein AQUCO_01000099v1 [Aquilegia coerulea]|uniref:Protein DETOXIFICATION n=1 Tax=Aquilegia coerulea TaxID=218851 RepID=A0A2G5E892_AQUCA|nr:hypothetical protein AQUCO_01000099v1 [Aquilegia coerulea]